MGAQMPQQDRSQQGLLAASVLDYWPESDWVYSTSTSLAQPQSQSQPQPQPQPSPNPSSRPNPNPSVLTLSG